MDAFRTLMVDAGLDDGAEARARLAAGLAARLGAHLVGHGARSVRPPVSGPMAGAAAVQQIIEAEVERVGGALRAAGDRFRRVAAEAGLPGAEWRAFLDEPGEAMAREARAADLLVVGRGGDGWDPGAAAPGDVLMRAGRPVLLAPPGAAAPEGRVALVAWKEGREARRAAADALPLLARAERVVVLAVSDEADGPGAGARARGPVEDAAAWLGRHGVRASGEVAAAAAGRGATDEILAAAARLGADLVVAGGYGRPRLLEWAFGGVTRGLLARCPVCCLLSH